VCVGMEVCGCGRLSYWFNSLIRPCSQESAKVVGFMTKNIVLSL
jgi:hypothetical protein